MGRVGRLRRRERARAARVTLLAIASLVFASSVALAGNREQALTPARNGLIAASEKGDIYLAYADGQDHGRRHQSRHRGQSDLAPDGRRIASIWGIPKPQRQRSSSFERWFRRALHLSRGTETLGLGNYGWTPDGDALVVQLDTPPFRIRTVGRGALAFRFLRQGQNSSSRRRSHGRSAATTAATIKWRRCFAPLRETASCRGTGTN